jgi:hypothetical protein
VWIGSGLHGIDGLSAGDPVTAERMRALFGCGLHPLAELRQQELEGPYLLLMAMSARFGLRWPNASRRSIGQLAFRRAPSCPPQTGPECGPRWPGSSSALRMVGSRLTPGNWWDRSRKTPDGEHRRWQAST